MSNLDRTGIFKAIPISWDLVTGKEGSKSVGLAIDYKITACQNAEKEWDDWTQYKEINVSGTVWVIKKNGETNAHGVESLVRSLGWDGDPGGVIDGPPKVECQIEVEENEWKGKITYVVKWLNPISSSGYTDIDKIAKEHGSKLRALASTIRAEFGAPGGNAELATPAPPGPPPPPKDDDDDDLPF